MNEFDLPLESSLYKGHIEINLRYAQIKKKKKKT